MHMHVYILVHFTQWFFFYYDLSNVRIVFQRQTARSTNYFNRVDSVN